MFIWCSESMLWCALFRDKHQPYLVQAAKYYCWTKKKRTHTRQRIHNPMFRSCRISAKRGMTACMMPSQSGADKMLSTLCRAVRLFHVCFILTHSIALAIRNAFLLCYYYYFCAQAFFSLNRSTLNPIEKFVLIGKCYLRTSITLFDILNKRILQWKWNCLKKSRKKIIMLSCFVLSLKPLFSCFIQLTFFFYLVGCLSSSSTFRAIDLNCLSKYLHFAVHLTFATHCGFVKSSKSRRKSFIC